VWDEFLFKLKKNVIACYYFSVVGGAMMPGLSGGERKRANKSQYCLWIIDRPQPYITRWCVCVVAALLAWNIEVFLKTGR
jgi:hypothetical protein